MPKKTKRTSRRKEKTKIRSFELFNDRKKEMIEVEQADDA